MTARQTTHRLRLLGALLAGALVLAACNRGANEAELLASARAYVEKQDYGAAIIQLKTALQKNPQSGQARLMLGLALLDSGDSPAAAIELRKALELGASATQVQPPLARALLAQNQPQQVLQQFAAIKLDNAEASADLKTSVAAAYAAMRQRDKALETVLSALKDSPQNVTALLLHARLKAVAGDLPGAMALVDQVLGIDAKHLGALMLKGDLQRYALRDRNAALATFALAAEAHPKTVAAHAAIVNMLLEQREIDKAKARFEILKKEQPSHPETRLFEAQFAFAEGNYARSRELTGQLLRVAPDDLVVLQLAGMTELRLNSLTQAEAHLSRVVKAQPRARLPRQELARIHNRKGQPEKALAVLRPVLESPSVDSESLTLAGEALLQSNDLERAEAAFAKAAKVDPQASSARLAMALAQLERGNMEAGFRQLETLAAADSGTRINQALIAARLRSNDIPAALRAIDDLQKKQPDSAVAHSLRAAALLQQKDTAGARANFEQALKIDPLFFPATAGIASIDLTEGNPEVAQKRFEDLLLADPRNPRALLALAELKARTGGSKDEITAAITRAVKANPQEPAPRLLLVNHLLNGRDTKAALTAAQEAASALPDDVDVMNILGTAQLAAGEPQQALTTLGRAVAAKPSSVRSNMLLAEAHIATKDYRKATSTLRRVLELDPKHLPAQRALIAVAMSEKRGAEALAVAKSIQQQRPQESVGYFAEAEIQAAQQHNDLAVAALKTAFDRRPETATAIGYHRMLLQANRPTDADRVAAAWRQSHPDDMAFLYYLGEVATVHNEFARAEQLFAAVVERQPNNAYALNNLAYALLSQGKPDSLNYATRANELLPDNPAVIDTLASALGLADRLPEAVQLQRKAVSLSKDAPLYRLHLAKLLLQAGDRDSARSELESLRRLGGRFDQQAEVTTLLARL
jgi:putative PEP-CTERM system TPR-repeat lipoprotein